MLAVIYPRSVNWFYRRVAELLCSELLCVGVSAELVPAEELSRWHGGSRCAIIVSVFESIYAAEKLGIPSARTAAALKRFDHRLLFNMDAILTGYYEQHFHHDRELVTEVLDYSAVRQLAGDAIGGLPYFWIAETLSREERQSAVSWSEGRPIPWATIGHVTPDRASLVAAAMDVLGSGGFVFLPPIRPFDQESGFEEAELLRVLRKSNVYLWGSHHKTPYHEGLRAVHAVVAGAVPAKIDPLNFGAFEDIPWVYSSLEAFRTTYERLGPKELYRRARSHLERTPGIGDQMYRTLAKLNIVA